MEGIPFGNSPLQLVGRTNKDIEREGGQECRMDLMRLVELVFGRHDDEDIHIAVSVRRSVRVRSKQDDFLRMKSLSNLAGEPLDNRSWDVCSSIPAPHLADRFFARHVAHRRILHYCTLRTYFVLPRCTLSRNSLGALARRQFHTA